MYIYIYICGRKYAVFRNRQNKERTHAALTFKKCAFFFALCFSPNGKISEEENKGTKKERRLKQRGEHYVHTSSLTNHTTNNTPSKQRFRDIFGSF